MLRDVVDIRQTVLEGKAFILLELVVGCMCGVSMGMVKPESL